MTALEWLGVVIAGVVVGEIVKDLYKGAKGAWFGRGGGKE